MDMCRVWLISLLLVGYSARAFSDDMTVLAAKAQRSMVIIETARGSGSGFILDMAGKKYLVTNDHVLRGGMPFKATLIDGTRLVASRVEVEHTRDLVRLPLFQADDLPGLKLASKEPTIGESVGVFGNSDGASVVTGMAGRILGIGPDAIEIDARFVRGNSGSPIVLADGSVVGVATFVTLSPDPRDWVKRGTRFSNVRRFGVRFSNVRWVSMTSEYDRLVSTVRSDLNATVSAKSRQTLSQVSRLVNKSNWRTEKMKGEAERWLEVYKTLAFPE